MFRRITSRPAVAAETPVNDEIVDGSYLVGPHDPHSAAIADAHNDLLVADAIVIAALMPSPPQSYSENEYAEAVAAQKQAVIKYGAALALRECQVTEIV